MEPLARVRMLTEDIAGELQAATKALEDRENQLIKERQELENEKQRMTALELSATDLVEINVGGEVLMTDRGTLTIAKGTVLEAMFSGRWEQSLKRDGAGRVFLDFSPMPFKALLSFLRASRDAGPGKSISSPVVPPEYQEEYDAMVGYLNLAEFLGCAVGGARLLGEDGSREKAAWKVTVRAVADDTCSFLTGVIGNASPVDKSYSDPTCWSWASYTAVRLAGTHTRGHGGWNGWMQGDVAVFQLDVSNGLRMFLRRSRQVYHIMQGVSADVTKQARVYFYFYGPGTEFEVSQVTAEDLAEAGF